MNIEHELEAIHENLLADTGIRYVSLKQLGGLNGLIRKGLENKSRMMRLKILERWAAEPMKRITGINKFTSSKNLTSSAASFLINLLVVPDVKPWSLNSYGRELIQETEKLILKEIGIEQLEMEI